jgi:hypothetical protein
MVTATEIQAKPGVIWRPHPGSQGLFLNCPIYECLYEGTRGPGKTDGLLMDFAQHVGRGFGTEWKDLLFRREYKEFDDLVEKSRKWFPRIFPGAKFIASKGDYKWVFPNGEKLFFRAAKRPSDYDNYHGHGYPWIGWEELTSWPNDELYIAMLSVCRSAHPGMPRHDRATCNPWGVGHHRVKARFIEPMPRGVVIEDEQGRERVAIHGEIWENTHLLENGPDWTDDKMLGARGGIYPHISRWYAALCLGSIGDKRAYEPLVRMLQQGTYLEDKFEITHPKKERYHISNYAAFALGYLGDPNAVELLIVDLRKNKSTGALFALTRLRDLRAIKPVIDYASDKDHFDLTTHRWLEYITGAMFRVRYLSKERKHTIYEFPELGKLDPQITYKVLWQHWWKERDRFAKRQFEKFYPQLKSLRKNRPNDLGSQDNAMRNMVRGGVPTLTFPMDAVEKGDELLIPLVAKLTNLKGRRFGAKGLQIESTATRTECLSWWENNENEWKVSNNILQ